MVKFNDGICPVESLHIGLPLPLGRHRFREAPGAVDCGHRDFAGHAPSFERSIPALPHFTTMPPGKQKCPNSDANGVCRPFSNLSHCVIFGLHAKTGHRCICLLYLANLNGGHSRTRRLCGSTVCDFHGTNVAVMFLGKHPTALTVLRESLCKRDVLRGKCVPG